MCFYAMHSRFIDNHLPMEDIDGDGFSTLEVSFSLSLFKNLFRIICCYCTIVTIALKNSSAMVTYGNSAIVRRLSC